MMPVVAGETSTRRQILVYALIMAAAAIAPWPLGYTGALYGWTAAILSAVFVLLSIQVGTRRTGEGDTMQPEKRSEEHTSELQSLMRISYAVFCLKKKKKE